MCNTYAISTSDNNVDLQICTTTVILSQAISYWSYYLGSDS